MKNVPKNFQDLKKKPKFLVTFTVGLDQWKNIDAAVKKVKQKEFSYTYHFDDDLVNRVF